MEPSACDDIYAVTLPGGPDIGDVTSAIKAIGPCVLFGGSTWLVRTEANLLDLHVFQKHLPGIKHLRPILVVKLQNHGFACMGDLPTHRRQVNDQSIQEFYFDHICAVARHWNIKESISVRRP